MKEKVLIADDERALRLLIRGTLEIGDYTLIEAENGVEALQKALMEKPVLVILDVMMPGMTGYEVCKNIKSNTDMENTKVLILTAKGQQTDKDAAFEAAADFYLSKPFSPLELLKMVDTILGRA